MSVREAFARIRKIGEDKETIYVCYVTSAKRKLEGVVTVKDLLLSDDDVILEDIMDTNVIYASTTDDQEEVSEMISNYDLIAIPVVDKERLSRRYRHGRRYHRRHGAGGYGRHRKDGRYHAVR